MDNSPSPKQKWTLTREALDGLLSWLDPDRERAGERYEEIRNGLVRGFRRHGCRTPEELADETINRVAKRPPEIVATYTGDPARYFYGVAHNVHMEHLRSPPLVPLPQTDLPLRNVPGSFELLDDADPVRACLTRCIEQLNPRSREMILKYYRGERGVKIKLRKELAEQLGLKMEQLRVQAQRVRKELKSCVLDCLGSQAGEMGLTRP